MSKKRKTNSKYNPIDPDNFDTAVRPQDNFYQYVNGSWFKKNKIPPNKNSWGTFDVIAEQNLKFLNSALKDLQKDKKTKPNSDKAKAYDLYKSSLNIKKRNRQETKYLQETLSKIESLQSRDQLTELLAHLHVRGIDAPWSLWFDQDDKNSNRMVLRIAQGGIGVPDRDYYVHKTKESSRIVDAYKKYLRKVLSLEGYYKKADIPSIEGKIVQIEKKLAKPSLTNVERRNVHKIYNKKDPKKLDKLCPSIDWELYFKLIGIPKKAWKHIILDEPKFLKEVHHLLSHTSIATLKKYLHWHFLDAYAGTLGQRYLDASFAYHGKTIQGLKKPTEPWKRAVRTTNSLMPDVVGRIFVEQHFPPTAKKQITSLSRNILRAYRDRIETLDWMSARTIKKALEKIDRMTLLLGYPSKWQSYKRLDVSQKSFTKNVLNATIFGFEIEAAKLARPTDPNEMPCSAATVNAFYSPNLNQMIFPAGILQLPLFNPKADDAVNYGAIGYILGHEMTHGFDDSGSKFDKNGNLHEWWTKNDKRRFYRKASALVKQFNKYHVLDGIHVNGKLTLGENIADLGGLEIAYNAFKKSQKNRRPRKIDGFTPDERFFISFAQSERRLMRDEFLKLVALTDSHSPHEFRTNGVVVNVDAFHETFKTKKGDALYKIPRSRVKIW